MEGEYFSWLQNISPLWWITLGFALAAAEMLVFSFFLMWPALAAFLMALILWVMPGLQGAYQIVLFAVLSLALTYIGRRMFQRYDEPETSLNDRSKQLIGKRAKVVLFDETGEGRVELNGLRWPATWPKGQNSEVGDVVVITNADGMSVEVENI